MRAVENLGGSLPLQPFLWAAGVLSDATFETAKVPISRPSLGRVPEDGCCIPVGGSAALVLASLRMAPVLNTFGLTSACRRHGGAYRHVD